MIFAKKQFTCEQFNVNLQHMKQVFIFIKRKLCKSKMKNKYFHDYYICQAKKIKISICMQRKMLLINNRRNKKPLCQLWPYLNIFYSKMNPLAILWFSSQFSTRFELNAENSVFVFVFWFSVFSFWCSQNTYGAFNQIVLCTQF